MTYTVEFKSEHTLRLLEELERLGGNVRSARNAISTSGAVDDVSLVVESRLAMSSTMLLCAAACSGPRKLPGSPPLIKIFDALIQMLQGT
jgi:hypothetical protein